MHTIKIAPTDADAYLTDQGKAQSLFDETAKALKVDGVVLDFKNVRATSPSWMFAVFGNLFMQFPDKFGKQLQIDNMNDVLRGQMDFTIEQAKQRLNNRIE